MAGGGSWAEHWRGGSPERGPRRWALRLTPEGKLKVHNREFQGYHSRKKHHRQVTAQMTSLAVTVQPGTREKGVLRVGSKERLGQQDWCLKRRGKATKLPEHVCSESLMGPVALTALRELSRAVLHGPCLVSFLGLRRHRFSPIRYLHRPHFGQAHLLRVDGEAWKNR